MDNLVRYFDKTVIYLKLITRIVITIIVWIGALWFGALGFDQKLAVLRHATVTTRLNV